jgi:hypothetical protein
MLTRRLSARFASCYWLATSRRAIDFCAEVIFFLFVFFLIVVVVEFIIVFFFLLIVFLFIEVVVVIIVVLFVPEVEVFVVVFGDADDILDFVFFFVVV